MNRCQIVQGTWWALQNLMKQAKFVAYEQNVIVYIFLLNFVMSFASAADHQASSAIVSKQSFNVKKVYTITFCSYATNFACFIKFWSAHHSHNRISHPSICERQIYITYDLFFAITKNHTLANSQRPAKSCYDNSHLFFKDLMSTEPIHNIKDSEKYETEYQCSKIH